MARLGTFGDDQTPLGWFGDDTSNLGWFDEDLTPAVAGAPATADDSADSWWSGTAQMVVRSLFAVALAARTLAAQPAPQEADFVPPQPTFVSDQDEVQPQRASSPSRLVVRLVSEEEFVPPAVVADETGLSWAVVASSRSVASLSVDDEIVPQSVQAAFDGEDWAFVLPAKALRAQQGFFSDEDVPIAAAAAVVHEDDNPQPNLLARGLSVRGFSADEELPIAAAAQTSFDDDGLVLTPQVRRQSQQQAQTADEEFPALSAAQALVFGDDVWLPPRQVQPKPFVASVADEDFPPTPAVSDDTGVAWAIVPAPRTVQPFVGVDEDKPFAPSGVVPAADDDWLPTLVLHAKPHIVWLGEEDVPQLSTPPTFGLEEYDAPIRVVRPTARVVLLASDDDFTPQSGAPSIAFEEDAPTVKRPNPAASVVLGSRVFGEEFWLVPQTTLDRAIAQSTGTDAISANSSSSSAISAPNSGAVLIFSDSRTIPLRSSQNATVSIDSDE